MGATHHTTQHQRRVNCIVPWDSTLRTTTASTGAIIRQYLAIYSCVPGLVLEQHRLLFTLPCDLLLTQYWGLRLSDSQLAAMNSERCGNMRDGGGSGDGSRLASAVYHRTTGVYCTTGRHCYYNSDCLIDNLTTTDYFGEHLQALSGNLVLHS
jgi:hypothetical protein